MHSVVYFNDLTLVHDKERDVWLLPNFAKVWARLSDASGISQLRCDDVTYGYAMRCIDAMPRGVVSSLLRNIMRRPFEYDETPRESHDEFWGCEFHCCDETGERVECRALGWSIVGEALSAGLCSSEFWKRLSIPVCISTVEGGERVSEALCVTTCDHVSDERVTTWCERVRSPIPQPTKLSAGEKKIAIHGDHHGNKSMRRFAEQLANSEYVLEVMSVDYQKSNSSPFINSILSDGRIRVCMYWEDIRFQLLVKTTAVNATQGEYVANLLAQRFDHGHRKR